VARIEIVVVGMAAHIFALRRAGVDVANAFVIGEEIDSLANPARVGNVARSSGRELSG
jgi:ABC-type nitrate/sulfonate/bicarbonate transport system substrate-binding protein